MRSSSRRCGRYASGPELPTWAATESFWQDYNRLSHEDQEAFLRAVAKLVDDLRRGQGLRSGLRLKRVRGTNPGVWEMTWAPDGRATFEYGEERFPGEPHILWRAIGGHDIFRNP